MENQAIHHFREEYFFLSNFYTTDIEYRGLRYTNAEAAFQAQKCLTDEEKQAFSGLEAAKAKRLGRRVSLRSDWETVKLGIMEEIVRAKFTQNEDLKEKLLATGDIELIEGNTWHDNCWGSCHCPKCGNKGTNWLGKLLMNRRAMLKIKEDN